MTQHHLSSSEASSLLQRLLRYPLILGGTFSALLFASVVQVSVTEHERDFSVAAKGAGIDFREHLNEGEMVINSIGLFFDASQHVTEEEFGLFIGSQFKTHVDIKSVRFIAYNGGDNRYARAASALPMTASVEAGGVNYSLHALYRTVHPDNHFIEPGWEMWNAPRTVGALGEAISHGAIVMGGMVVLDDGSIAFNQYKAVYSRERDGELLGVIAVLFRPADVLEHIAADYEVNGALRVGERAAGFFNCCLEQSERLLPLLGYEEEFEFRGVPMQLSFSRGLAWENVHMKLAVMAFVIGTLLSMAMYRLRMANAERTRLLLERNRTIKRQVDEQTRALRQTNAELEQEKAAVDEHAIVSIADTTGNIIYINEKFCEISGYHSDELLGRNHRIVKSERHPPEFYDEMWSTISQGKVWHGEVCNRNKSGEEYWVHSTIVPFVDDRGVPYQYVSIRTDITAMKAAKLTITAHESELNSILNNVPALIWYKDCDSRIVRANQSAAALAGLSPEEMAGRPHSDFFPSEAVERYRADDLKVLQSGEPLLDLRESIDGEDGEHHFRVDRVPYRDATGEIVGLIVVAHDVTQQEETERALLVNEERLRRSQTFANIGTWDWNIQSGDLFWSERIAPLFGYEVGALETTYENFLNAVHPDDRDLVQGAVGGCVESGIEYNIEHRVVWPDGQVRWLSEKGDVVRDEAGNPLHMLGVVSDIHDRKMAEAALAESEQQLREAQRMARIGNWQADMLSGELTWSDEIYRIFGYEPGSFEPSVERFKATIHPDDRVLVEESEKRAEQTGRHDVVHRIVQPDGAIRHVHELAQAETDAEGNLLRLRGTVQDVTERFEAEALVLESEEKFRSLYEMSPVGIALNEMDGSFIESNQAFLDIVGYTSDECRGLTYWELTPQEYAPQEAEQLESLNTAGRYGPYEKEYIRKDGQRVGVLLNGTIIHDREGNQRIWSIVQDITERKAMQERLVEAKETAEQANRAKSEFLSSMSHELRTPLNAILGFSQLMEGDENLTDDQRESLHDIGNAGGHLLDLINEVLDLAKIEAGKMELSISTVVLADVMEAGKNLLSPMAERRDIQLAFSPICLDGCFVSADFTRTKQVLLNLLSNAVKYNREGGSIQVDCQTMENDRLRISVTDTGEGIPEVKLKGLFEAFNRLDAEGGNIEGTGIGLVITRQLVELMGGEIGVDSVVGEGSTFWFELPRAEGESVAKRVATVEAEADEGGLGAGRSVLYIEDNPVNLKLVAKLIEKRTAIDLLSAEEPVSGIELALEHKPDLILLDINLPEMSGYEVLRHLRDMAETHDIPVVALSANAMSGDLQKGQNAGFDGYLTKPINVKEFFRVLEQMLG